eukprot:gb/GFBE01048088.1/.p1 GENE.gb/GFBE01048088.1/~~gb/GFBE01048088.1/.p1  ORF type:complete len:295 (+),score=97.24 gb/GFBE01048088.1/:1-885(+)
MNDYSKWDKLVDSDDEDKEDKQQREADAAREDYAEACREEHAKAEQWLRRNMALAMKAEDEERMQRTRHSPPELIKNSQEPMRKASKEDLRVLGMFMVINDFGEGETNLTRHPQILDFVRHHRWLEEDPGALELLCRIHNNNMKACEDKNRPALGQEEKKRDSRFRNMCLSAINTLAAPKKAGCPGGLLELVNMICTPSTPQGHEMRLKWQKKEFGKDALFESLFPDLKQFKDDDEGGDNWWEVWLMVGFIVLIIVVLGLLMVYGLPPSRPPKTTTTTSLLAAAASADVGKPEL